MPSTLQELRRRAGYASAKEFAESIGVPFSTYSRYESNPDKISVAAAWSLADRLGCSIDAIVGRATIDDVELNRGRVQREYDALDPECRALMDGFRAYVRWFAKNKEKAARRNVERQYEQLALHYEDGMRRAQMAEAAGRGEFFRPLSGEEARDAFRRHVEALAAEKRKYQDGDPAENERKDEATIEQLMDAYDRIHDWADRLPEEEL